MTISAVLFDLDGTMIDSTQCILECFKAGFSAIDLDYPGDDVIQSMFGQSLDHILQLLGIPEERRDHFKTVCRATGRACTRITLIPGIDTVLTAIKEQHIPIGVVTSKSEVSSKDAFKKVPIAHFFDVIINASHTTKHKPHPDPLLVACKQLNVNNDERVLYVGDTKYDLIAAARANLTPIGVMWGVHKEKMKEALQEIPLNKKIFFVNTPQELLTLLNDLHHTNNPAAITKIQHQTPILLSQKKQEHGKRHA